MNISQIIELLSDDFFKSNGSKDIEMYKRIGSISERNLEKRTMACEPCSFEIFEQREKSLNIKLPPSYREFLLASNGFGVLWTCLNNLLPIEKVDWSKNTESKWSLDMFLDEPFTVSDEQYFYYDSDQDPVLSRTSYIVESLKISEWYEGLCLFLNPLVKFGDEWEVLEYATWHPGIRRFKSFQDYLLNIHELNLRHLNQDSQSNIS